MREQSTTPQSAAGVWLRRRTILAGLATLVGATMRQERTPVPAGRVGRARGSRRWPSTTSCSTPTPSSRGGARRARAGSCARRPLADQAVRGRVAAVDEPAVVDFQVITEDALVYAAHVLNVTLGPEEKRRLVEAYLHLRPWPDSVDALRTLRRSGVRVIVLANFSPAMLRANAEHAGMLDLFDALVSTDANHTYKPGIRAPTTSVCGSFGSPGTTWRSRPLVAGTPPAPPAFGYPTCWVNRAHQPPRGARRPAGAHRGRPRRPAGLRPRGTRHDAVTRHARRPASESAAELTVKTRVACGAGRSGAQWVIVDRHDLEAVAQVEARRLEAEGHEQQLTAAAATGFVLGHHQQGRAQPLAPARGLHPELPGSSRQPPQNRAAEAGDDALVVGPHHDGHPLAAGDAGRGRVELVEAVLEILDVGRRRFVADRESQSGGQAVLEADVAHGHTPIAMSSRRRGAGCANRYGARASGASASSTTGARCHSR